MYLQVEGAVAQQVIEPSPFNQSSSSVKIPGEYKKELFTGHVCLENV